MPGDNHPTLEMQGRDAVSVFFHSFYNSINKGNPCLGALLHEVVNQFFVLDMEGVVLVKMRPATFRTAWEDPILGHAG